MIADVIAWLAIHRRLIARSGAVRDHPVPPPAGSMAGLWNSPFQNAFHGTPGRAHRVLARASPDDSLGP